MASQAHVILKAVYLTTNGEISALCQLTTESLLRQEHLLRILLTYLPEGTDPQAYTGLLLDISKYGFYDPRRPPSVLHTPALEEISEAEARRRVRRLRLTPLASSDLPIDSNTDPLTLFLVRQAHKIDADTGSTSLILQLLEPFVDHSETLQTWMISNLLPLFRSEYEYYPRSTAPLSLADFERLEGRVAIQSLLSKAAQKDTHGERVEIGRDLRCLVGPWMYGEGSRKRRKLDHGHGRTGSLSTAGATKIGEIAGGDNRASDWSYVNESLLELGIRNYPRAVDAFVQWAGPTDVDYGAWGNDRLPVDEDNLSEPIRQYAQAGLAVNYATNDASMETIMGSHRVLVRVAETSKVEEPLDLKRSDTQISSGITQEYLNSLSPAHLLYNALLGPRNPLTSPSNQATALFNIVLASCYKLLNLGNVRSCKRVVELILFSTASDQIAELRKTLHKLKSEKMDEPVWASVRRQLLWLRDWEEQSNDSTKEPRGTFNKISATQLEKEILRAIVDGGCYTLAIEVYCKKESPLPKDTVEDAILASAFSSYDAASNGNRTRGGVRRAFDIISTFRSYFSESERFAQTTALLSATHAMSFYSLILHHGVPFQPVNIRAHKDPMSLIGKILDQNPRSYTHLDDLLEIGQNLVVAGLGGQNQARNRDPYRQEPTEDDTTIARRRIIRMAIEAALAEDDFDTAYSYVVNRLSLLSQSKPYMDRSERAPTAFDDISWRAAYAAGRYTTSDSVSSALRRLEQRMELLSQALLLAPPSSLPEVLGVWQECEKQMTERVVHEAAEEERWEKSGSHPVPGGFSGESSPVQQKPRDPTKGSLQEEAPMGLFDVARGAATALSKNAFPLRGPQKAEPASKPRSRPLSFGSLEGSDDGSIVAGEGPGRARKRDMVSNMVTGGLASGIGWVIGESDTALVASRLLRIV